MSQDLKQPKPAMHHLSLHGEDSLSLPEIIDKLERLEPSTLSYLGLSWAELNDKKVDGIMKWLNEPGRKSVLPAWACSALFQALNNQPQVDVQSLSLDSNHDLDSESLTSTLVPKLPSLLYHIQSPSTHAIRILILSSNHITSKSLDSISGYVSYNSSITTLDLSANRIGVSLLSLLCSFFLSTDVLPRLLLSSQNRKLWLSSPRQSQPRLSEVSISRQILWEV